MSGQDRQRHSRRPYALAVLFLGFLVLAAWMGRDEFRPVTAGAAAPAFEFPDLEGQPVRLADYRGRVVLINIWATWCPPCRHEMPSMERLRHEIDSRDFEILAVSVDAAAGETDAGGRPGASKDALRRFVHEHGLTFPVLRDRRGEIQSLYRTTGVPESFLVDRDGTIVRKVSGATEWDHPTYVALVRRLLAG